MKRLNLLMTFVLLASTLLFTSCQKDPEEQIIGTWTVTEDESAFYFRYDKEYEVTKNEFLGTTFTFNDDKSLILNIRFEDEDEVITETDTCSWNIADDYLYLTQTDEDGECQTLKTNLTLDGDDMNIYLDEGTIDGYKNYESYTLKRNK